MASLNNTCWKNLQNLSRALSDEQAFTCSKSTIETLKRVRHIFEVNKKGTRMTSLVSFLCLSYWLLTYFTPFSSAYIVDFEQVPGDDYSCTLFSSHKYWFWILKITVFLADIGYLVKLLKQPLGNLEPQKPWKYKQLWGMRPDPSCL